MIGTIKKFLAHPLLSIDLIWISMVHQIKKWKCQLRNIVKTKWICHFKVIEGRQLRLFLITANHKAIFIHQNKWSRVLNLEEMQRGYLQVRLLIKAMDIKTIRLLLHPLPNLKWVEEVMHSQHLSTRLLRDNQYNKEEGISQWIQCLTLPHPLIKMY